MGKPLILKRKVQKNETIKKAIFDCKYKPSHHLSTLRWSLWQGKPNTDGSDIITDENAPYGSLTSPALPPNKISLGSIPSTPKTSSKSQEISSGGGGKKEIQLVEHTNRASLWHERTLSFPPTDSTFDNKRNRGPESSRSRECTPVSSVGKEKLKEDHRVMCEGLAHVFGDELEMHVDDESDKAGAKDQSNPLMNLEMNDVNQKSPPYGPENFVTLLPVRPIVGENESVKWVSSVDEGRKTQEGNVNRSVVEATSSGTAAFLGHPPALNCDTTEPSSKIEPSASQPSCSKIDDNQFAIPPPTLAIDNEVPGTSRGKHIYSTRNVGSNQLFEHRMLNKLRLTLADCKTMSDE
ncbi:unnamed protein product [Orchesella dallaii]|uniref:Uncharacterized protein n=1 Tax=Orchesella dallaii TaxID=48710 RepID=A0ABP1R211_9HEXA